TRAASTSPWTRATASPAGGTPYGRCASWAGGTRERRGDGISSACVEVSEAADLITAAVTEGGTWADLGAGSGTFTRALASLLGAAGTVYAVDRSPSVRNLARRGDEAGAAVLPIMADF